MGESSIQKSASLREMRKSSNGRRRDSLSSPCPFVGNSACQDSARTSPHTCEISSVLWPSSRMDSAQVRPVTGEVDVVHDGKMPLGEMVERGRDRCVVTCWRDRGFKVEHPRDNAAARQWSDFRNRGNFFRPLGAGNNCAPLRAARHLHNSGSALPPLAPRIFVLLLA